MDGSRCVLGVYTPVSGRSRATRRRSRGELATSGVDAVLVEPGPFSTALFPTSPAPADNEGRTAGYDPAVPATLAGMKEGFGQMFEDDSVPT